MEVKIKKLVPEAVIPTYAKSGDTGMDIICTSVEYDAKMDCYIYHTGLDFEVPSGYGLFMFARSSNRKKDVYLPNGVGILDSGYRGEMLFCYKDRNSAYTKTAVKGILGLYSDKDVDDIMDEVTISLNALEYAPYKVGDKIGQIVIMPYPQINFVETDTLSDSERGEGGFGSTGE